MIKVADRSVVCEGVGVFIGHRRGHIHGNGGPIGRVQYAVYEGLAVDDLLKQWHVRAHCVTAEHTQESLACLYTNPHLLIHSLRIEIN